MAAMTLARLALFVAVYVSLDLSNPMMPGALTFGGDSSVEMRQADRFRGQAPEAAPIPRAPAPERRDPADRPVTVRRLPAPETRRLRQPHVARSRLSRPASTSLSEDH
jgi:hypothetical protein